MHTHHRISRRHLLGLTGAVGGLVLARGVRHVWAQATGGSGPVTLDVRHPDLHTLIAPEAPLTRIAGGLGFAEGPVWRGTALLFSDIPKLPANLAWGEDGSVLFLTARTSVYRLPTLTSSVLLG